MARAVRSHWRRVQDSSPASGHVLFTVGTNVAIAVLTLATGTIAARLLGPSGRGELAAIQTWAPFIATMALLGVTDALVFFSARDPGRAGRYLGSAITLALLSGSGFLLVGYVVMPYLLAAQSPAVVTAARWYLLIIPILAVAGVPLNVLRGRNELVTWNGLRLAQTFAWLSVLLIALTLGKGTAPWLTGAHLVAMAVLAIPTIWVVRERVRGSWRPDRTLYRPLLAYGIPAIAGTVPQLLNSRVDQLLMAAFLPPRALGLYVVGVAWSSASGPLITALGNVVFPRVAAEAAAREGVRILTQTSRIGTLVATGLGALLMLGTPLAVPFLFGEEFAPAIPATLILVGAGVFGGMNNILEESVRGLGRPQLVLWSEGAGLIVAAGALAALLPSLGILGAALASLFSYATTSAVLVAYIARIGGCSASDVVIPRRQDVRLVIDRLKLVAGR